MDNIIEAKEVQIERKHFWVEFRENERGKLPLQLRVVEYRQAHLRVIFYPVGGQYSGWKVLRCVDLSTNKALSVTD